MNHYFLLAITPHTHTSTTNPIMRLYLFMQSMREILSNPKQHINILLLTTRIRKKSKHWQALCVSVCVFIRFFIIVFIELAQILHYTARNRAHWRAHVPSSTAQFSARQFFTATVINDWLHLIVSQLTQKILNDRINVPHDDISKVIWLKNATQTDIVCKRSWISHICSDWIICCVNNKFKVFSVVCWFFCLLLILFGFA